MTTDEIKNSLIAVLPRELHHAAGLLASLLSSVIDGVLTEDVLQERIDSNTELKNTIKALSGKNISTHSSVFSFGEGNQVGDVAIRDLAGRDIIRVSLILNFYSTGHENQGISGIANKTEKSRNSHTATLTGNVEQRLLKIFLCHSSSDKMAIRQLYEFLRSEGFDPWLDEENILPGQDWKQEIARTVRTADAIVICLSKTAINKSGFVQKEIRDALDIADNQPDGSIFLIPVRLENCDVPERLTRWQWVDLYEKRGQEKLLRALRTRAEWLCKEEQTIIARPPISTSDITGSVSQPAKEESIIDLAVPSITSLKETNDISIEKSLLEEESDLTSSQADSTEGLELYTTSSSFDNQVGFDIAEDNNEDVNIKPDDLTSKPTTQQISQRSISITENLSITNKRLVNSIAWVIGNSIVWTATFYFTTLIAIYSNMNFMIIFLCFTITGFVISATQLLYFKDRDINSKSWMRYSIVASVIASYFVAKSISPEKTANSDTITIFMTVLTYFVGFISLCQSFSHVPISAPRKGLTRDLEGSVIAGICSGIALYYGVNAVMVRFLFILAALLSGISIPVYIVLWIIMPRYNDLRNSNPTQPKIKRQNSNQEWWWFALSVIGSITGVFISRFVSLSLLQLAIYSLILHIYTNIWFLFLLPKKKL